MTRFRIWFTNYLKLMIVPGIILFFVGAYFTLISPLTPPAEFATPPWVGIAGTLFFSPLTIVMGFVVTRKQPDSMIGTAIVLWGCAVAIQLSGPYSLPWFGAVGLLYMMTVSFPSLFLMVASFPTGRMLSPLWDRVMYGLMMIIVAISLLFNLTAPSAYLTDSPSPITIHALTPLFSVLSNLTNLLFTIAMLLSCALLIYRYRIASARERKQIRWLALFGLYMAIQLVMNLIVPIQESTFYTNIVAPLSIMVLTFMPGLAIGMAILRHRLYDIDIIIRRTLIYTVLTTILGIVYFGGIVLTQQAFVALTGQTNELAIVVSTLLIAALFAPLRRRVQDVIDRRLYRKKYDVEQVLADFQKNLRDEVDMETLKANLIGVVSETMQPDKIALWVKEPKSS